MNNKNKQGKLYMVSAGIGDPDNMTLRAYKTILEADIVLAMKFIRNQYSDMLEGKEVYDAGHGLFSKMAASVKYGDEDKVRSIVRDGVTAGKIVVVLDFGDPTLYSPQSGYLKEFADLRPEVIPGISSFNAANAAIGLEITDDYNRAVVLSEAMSNWGNEDRLEKLAATGAILVFFSMHLDIGNLVLRLKNYFSSNTPVAVVCSAGLKNKEKVIRTTLASLAQCMKEERPSWDYLIYVGC